MASVHDDRDDQIHALFRHLDDGPPLGIDVREVMARGRRVRARRTGLAVVGSGLAVTAALLVAVGIGEARPPGVVRPADPTPVTTPVTTPAPSSAPNGATSPPQTTASPTGAPGQDDQTPPLTTG